MQPQNLRRQLLHELGRKIVGGDLLPGHVLPKVEVLSDMKGVSRTVTREALKGLEARSLVDSQPKTGTIIRPRSQWQWWNRDVLQWAVDAKSNREFLLQLTEVRIGIEPAIVAIAAKNATKSDIRMMEEKFRVLEASVGDEFAWATADYEFHDSILQASHNELMVSLVQTMREALLYSRSKTFKVLRNKSISPNEEATTDALVLHRSVLEAVSKGDGNLAYIKMHELLMAVVELIEEMNEPGGDS